MFLVSIEGTNLLVNGPGPGPGTVTVTRDLLLRHPHVTAYTRANTKVLGGDERCLQAADLRPGRRARSRRVRPGRRRASHTAAAGSRRTGSPGPSRRAAAHGCEPEWPGVVAPTCGPGLWPQLVRRWTGRGRCDADSCSKNLSSFQREKLVSFHEVNKTKQTPETSKEVMKVIYPNAQHELPEVERYRERPA